jgi:hypothetical protein
LGFREWGGVGDEGLLTKVDWDRKRREERGGGILKGSSSSSVGERLQITGSGTFWEMGTGSEEGGVTGMCGINSSSVQPVKGTEESITATASGRESAALGIFASLVQPLKATIGSTYSLGGEGNQEGRSIYYSSTTI